MLLAEFLMTLVLDVAMACSIRSCTLRIKLNGFRSFTAASGRPMPCEVSFSNRFCSLPENIGVCFSSSCAYSTC